MYGKAVQRVTQVGKGEEKPGRRRRKGEKADNKVLEEGNDAVENGITMNAKHRGPPHIERESRGENAKEDGNDGEADADRNDQRRPTSRRGAGRRTRQKGRKKEKEEREENTRIKKLVGCVTDATKLVGCVAEATPNESIELPSEIGEGVVNRPGSVGNSELQHLVVGRGLSQRNSGSGSTRRRGKGRWRGRRDHGSRKRRRCGSGRRGANSDPLLFRSIKGVLFAIDHAKIVVARLRKAVLVRTFPLLGGTVGIAGATCCSKLLEICLDFNLVFGQGTIGLDMRSTTVEAGKARFGALGGGEGGISAVGGDSVPLAILKHVAVVALSELEDLIHGKVGDRAGLA